MHNYQNLVKQIMNNSWNEAPVSREQAEAKITKIVEDNKRNERIEKFINRFGANGRYV